MDLNRTLFYHWVRLGSAPLAAVGVSEAQGLLLAFSHFPQLFTFFSDPNWELHETCAVGFGEQGALA